MTTLVLPEGMPEGARSLGLRITPSLRLSIGFRNPQRRNAPDKLDHFRPKEGANGEYAAAARKFVEVYGEQAKAIDIVLPARIEDALRIEYLAFRGNRDDPAGGVMVARGDTNFVPLGYCGGPDMLTVWDQDGTVRHVQTAGLNGTTREPLDEVARGLDLMLCTTLRVGLPAVLGFGSVAEITSKSLRSTDQLWLKLRDWYAMFPHGTITFAMRPKLIVKGAWARPMVKTKDGPKRIRSLVYVLDVVAQETQDEMVERLERARDARGELAVPQPVAAIEAGPPVEAVPLDQMEELIEDGEIVDESGGGHGGPGEPDTGIDPSLPDETPAAAELAEASGDAPDPNPDEAGPVEQDAILTLPDEVASTEPVMEEPVLADVAPAPDGPSPEDIAAAEVAGKVRPPFGSYQTRTLSTIIRHSSGAEWLGYAIRLSATGNKQIAGDPFERHLWAFVKVHLPDLYREHEEHAK